MLHDLSEFTFIGLTLFFFFFVILFCPILKTKRPAKTLFLIPAVLYGSLEIRTKTSMVSVVMDLTKRSVVVVHQLSVFVYGLGTERRS